MELLNKRAADLGTQFAATRRTTMSVKRAPKLESVRRLESGRHRAMSGRTNRFMALEPLVERLLEEGRSAEAELVVSEYLGVLLQIAHESRPVTQSKCDLAGMYALKLA